MAIDSVTIVKIMNIIAAIEKFKKPYLINAIPGCNKLVEYYGVARPLHTVK